ncbi:MAG TPA: hypothetical protein VFT74_09940, partial [Isosphaeraceae bacterium]|nr:hypothetical protein [Isosphaeraceae bacterium]
MAVVSVEPATGGQLVRVARGPSARKLTKGNVFGPFGNEELTWRFQEVVDSLRQEGFMPTGLHSLLESLHAPQPSTRARAAARLGWRRSVEAVAPLIDALGESVDETCSLIDALGAIGDARAIPVVREYASRKLLSRRRSAVEALRSLGDTEGLSAAVERARESLPETVRAALDASDSGDDTPASTSALSETIRALDPKYQGLALDTLYEIGTAASTGAVRLIVETLSFDRPYHWRYLKSIYKRSMLRHDLATFASLSVSI